MGVVMIVVVMMMVSGRESRRGAEDQDGENDKLFHVLILARERRVCPEFVHASMSKRLLMRPRIMQYQVCRS